jgi:hypothetical protein
VGARPDRARARLGVAGLCKKSAAHGERCSRKRYRSGAKEAASAWVNELGHGSHSDSSSYTIRSYAI